MFKEGDKVKCVNDGDKSFIKEGGVYTVTGVYSIYCTVCVGGGARYYQKRFIKVNTFKGNK